MTKKAKKKRKNNNMPPLSWLDKLIYYVGIILSVCAMFGCVAVVILMSERIAYSNPEVIAYSPKWIVFLCLPASMMFLAYSFILGEQYKRKTPIFGQRDFRYGPPLYKEKYPLFMKEKPHIRMTQRQKHSQTVTAIVLVSATIISLFLYPFSFCGRNVLLSDGHMITYNAFNRETKAYDSANVVSIAFSTDSDRHSKYITVTFRMDDNGTCSFSSDLFRENWLNEMLTIKARYPQDMISFNESFTLDSFAYYENLSDEEIGLLYDLFNKE